MIKVTLPPTWEPVSLLEVKRQCRIETDFDGEDALLMGYISSARAWCEKFDSRAYATQTIEVWLDGWPTYDDSIEMPRPPLQSVTSVVYYTTDDVVHTFDAAKYFVDTVSMPGRVCLRYNQVWPVTPLRYYNAVCVTAGVGFASPEVMPPQIRQAILLLVGHWYENREDTISGTAGRSIEMGVKALLGVDRVIRF